MSSTHLRHFVTSLRNEKVREFDGKPWKFVISTDIWESSSLQWNFGESSLLRSLSARVVSAMFVHRNYGTMQTESRSLLPATIHTLLTVLRSRLIGIQVAMHTGCKPAGGNWRRGGDWHEWGGQGEPVRQRGSGIVPNLRGRLMILSDPDNSDIDSEEKSPHRVRRQQQSSGKWLMNPFSSLIHRFLGPGHESTGDSTNTGVVCRQAKLILSRWFTPLGVVKLYGMQNRSTI
jgi:hypothetical protein